MTQLQQTVTVVVSLLQHTNAIVKNKSLDNLDNPTPMGPNNPGLSGVQKKNYIT